MVDLEEVEKGQLTAMAGTWKSRFHEVIHGQQPGDGRRHIVWVVIAGNMHRCSVHSVRKVTERERLDFELCDTEDPATWKSLADMLPNHSYIDVTNEEPDENEVEAPDLPLAPGTSTARMGWFKV
jgi:hypothetical protein